jgi:hypothetical protein
MFFSVGSQLSATAKRQLAAFKCANPLCLEEFSRKTMIQEQTHTSKRRLTVSFVRLCLASFGGAHLPTTIGVTGTKDTKQRNQCLILIATTTTSTTTSSGNGGTIKLMVIGSGLGFVLRLVVNGFVRALAVRVRLGRHLTRVRAKTRGGDGDNKQMVARAKVRQPKQKKTTAVAQCCLFCVERVFFI